MTEPVANEEWVSDFGGTIKVLKVEGDKVEYQYIKPGQRRPVSIPQRLPLVMFLNYFKKG
jgi:hypothetical protein